ncbi:MAG: hypothetical protein IPH43_12205 [Xanthomonadales bacterium]|nr:hypothetical protein [Xanthomonadales bacterium]
MSWSRSLKQAVVKDRQLAFRADRVVSGLYRPFLKQWLYFDRPLNEYVFQMPRIFPHASSVNRVITLSNIGSKHGFSALMTDLVADFQVQFNGQCFPLYLYDEATNADDAPAPGLFDQPKGQGQRTSPPRRHHRRWARALPECLSRREDHQGRPVLLRLRSAALARLPRTLRRQSRQGAAAHPARENRRRLPGVQQGRSRTRRPAPGLRDRADVRQGQGHRQ